MGGHDLHPEQLSEAIYKACMAELDAPKPGNVHKFKSGHDMDWQQFEASAKAIAPILVQMDFSFGQRVLRAVEATRAVAGCNTNLGIILLAAPLAEAALRHKTGSLRRRVTAVLADFSKEDTEGVFKAIALASPGGLGAHPDHDVRNPATISLMDAMTLAAPKDSIAKQYCTGFADIVGYGSRRVRWAKRRWPTCPWAPALWSYLGFLGHMPDSHVERKYGSAPAEHIMRIGKRLDRALLRTTDPEKLLPALLSIDEDFKTQQINPGTSADMTVGSLLSANLMAMITPGKLE